MKKLVTGLFVVLALGILLGYGISWMSQKPQTVADELPALAVQEMPGRSVELYYTAPEGTFLVPETAEIPGCDEDRDCIRSLLGELIQGSQVNLPVLPKETRVLNVEIENDLVRIDFSRHLADFHPGGSLSELLSIYSIANSLSENFPYIRQVQLLIEGEIRSTLKGHARIDQPIYADFSFNSEPLSGVLEEQTNTDMPDDKQLSIEKLIQDAARQQSE